AELSRIFAVVKLGGGSVLGPQYYDWVRWIRHPMGSAGYIIAILVWVGASTGLTHWLWERGRAR
ncbi:ABC transporter permease, partial [Paenibacillus glucanolyticus]